MFVYPEPQRAATELQENQVMTHDTAYDDIHENAWPDNAWDAAQPADFHVVLRRAQPPKRGFLHSRFGKATMSLFGAMTGTVAAAGIMTGTPAYATSLFAPFARAMSGVHDMQWPDLSISYDWKDKKAAQGAGAAAGNDNALPAPTLPRGFNADGTPIVDCSAMKPIVFRGWQHDIVITNPSVCYDLDRMLPAEGETIQFSDQIKLTGHKFGAVEFQLNDMIPVVIPTERYRGFIEAWLVSGGSTGQPVPAEYFYAKWHLESAFGMNMHNPNSSACGTNQFVEGTFIQVVDEAGHDHGYDREADMADAFARRSEVKDYGEALDDPEYLQWFRRECVRPVMSMILGARHSIKGIGKMEELVLEGKIELPDGRTQITATDAYIGAQLLGYGKEGAQRFYKALKEHPNWTMKRIMGSDVYNRNDYFFEEERPVIDRSTCRRDAENHVIAGSCQYKTKRVPDMNPETDQQRVDGRTGEKLWKTVNVTKTHYLTAREFYYQEVAQRWGFGFQPLPSLANWQPAPYVASGTVYVKPVQEGGELPQMRQMQAGFNYIYQGQNEMQVVQVPRAAPAIG